MLVKVQIFETKGNFLETKESYEELNDKEYTIEDFKKGCIEDFFADTIEYLDPDNCSVYILGDKEEEDY